MKITEITSPTAESDLQPNAPTEVPRRALIVGLGVAGLAAANRLHQVGWHVVVAERAAKRRGGGYMVALFGAGQAAAERMGLLEAIGNRFDDESGSFEIDRAGRKRPGLSLGKAPGGARLLLRGDVEAALFGALPGEIDLRFSTSPTEIRQDELGVEVTLRDAAAATERVERFDLLIGADGVHSTVRRLAFGPDAAFLKPVNHVVAAALLARPVVGFQPNDGLILSEPGRSAWVFAFADHEPAVMMTYRSNDVAGELERPPAEALRRAFAPEPLGPVLTDLIGQYEAADTKLFDAAEQVTMPTWYDHRVVLLGDAAWCMTLYSGMGVSTALAGADFLATELERHPDDLPRALGNWETRLRPFVVHHQEQSMQEGLELFVPKDQSGIRKRSAMFRANGIPLVKDILGELAARSVGSRMKALDVAAP